MDLTKTAESCEAEYRLIRKLKYMHNLFIDNDLYDNPANRKYIESLETKQDERMSLRNVLKYIKTMSWYLKFKEDELEKEMKASIIAIIKEEEDG